jgi:hypothetical protein
MSLVTASRLGPMSSRSAPRVGPRAAAGVDRGLTRTRSWPGLLALTLAWAGSSGRAAEPLPPTVEFNRDIRPILSDACYHCHGPDKAKRKAKLRLDTEDGAFADLGGYRAFVPGSLDESEAYQRITAEDDVDRMPPVDSGRHLTPRQVELIGRWIEQGARWQKHWSLIPPQRPTPPGVEDPAWIRNPIDAFILDRLGREGIDPSPEADKTTLIRRVTLALTGLPPSPAEVDAFLADDAPDAYETVVDRLLRSPRYGERMALEWLDAARYADSNGYQQDGTRTLWPWRDWVVEALNRNMPFDRFTIEQLAGDRLPGATPAQKVATGFHRNHMLNGEGGRIPEESRVDYVVDRVDTTATVWLGLTLGCARCHDHKYDPFAQRDYYRIFAYFNDVAETGRVDRGGNAAPVLALPTPEQTATIAALNRTIADLERQQKAEEQTLLSAQPQWEDATRAELAGPLARLVALAQIPPDRLSESQKKELADQAAKITRPAPIIEILLTPTARRSDGQKKELAVYHLDSSPVRQALRKRLAESRKALEGVNGSIVQTMVMEDRPEPRETFVLQRGAYDKPGEKVSPGVPASLPPLPEGAPPDRLGFARWLVDPANPLTARVTVNRTWQLFFGAGIVKTAEDFGVQGEPPSHPELLDWLATEFVRTGWDVKALHRLIVTSAAYRQSSGVTPTLRERDPENRLLARGPRHRLSSLVLRDQALAISGLLVERVGGRPVRPYQPPGIWEEMSFGKIAYQQDHGDDLYRRSLYTFWRRTVGPTDLFDAPARQVCTVRQGRTNTPLHALVLLNDVTYVEAARVFAERLMKEGGSTPEGRITRAFLLATARPPGDAEQEILARSLHRLLEQFRADPDAARKLVGVGEAPRDPQLDVTELAAYTGLASLILNLDEVITNE